MSKDKLKPARSQAELVRTRNSNILLVIAFLQASLNIMVAGRIFELW